jgi:hypothetical protein
MRAADHAAEISPHEVRILVGQNIGLHIAEGGFGLVFDPVVEGLDDVLFEPVSWAALPLICAIYARAQSKPTGMGIGLSICRSIIEAHEGRIWATANMPRGATLHITLPVSGKAAFH